MNLVFSARSAQSVSSREQMARTSTVEGMHRGQLLLASIAVRPSLDAITASLQVCPYEFNTN